MPSVRTCGGGAGGRGTKRGGGEAAAVCVGRSAGALFFGGTRHAWLPGNSTLPPCCGPPCCGGACPAPANDGSLGVTGSTGTGSLGRADGKVALAGVLDSTANGAGGGFAIFLGARASAVRVPARGGLGGGFTPRAGVRGIAEDDGVRDEGRRDAPGSRGLCGAGGWY